MNKKIPLITIVLLLSMLLSSCAGVAAAQTTDSAQNENAGLLRTISVNGSGVATLTPDIAYVSIGVRTENEDAARAVAENNTLSKQVSDTIKDTGVDEQDIQTTNFSIHPEQEYGPDGKPTGEIMYVVNNTVYVTVRDLAIIGDLLNSVVAAGANTIHGIQFDVDDKNAALSAARQSAVENAEEVAEELAEAAGVTLGDVQSITTFRSDVPAPIYVERAAAPMLAESVPVSPGQMNITVQVSVVYQIQ